MTFKAVPVQVFRLGDDAVKQQPVKPDADIQKDGYALCVSTVEARKNHLLLFYAVREGLSRGEQLLPIVVVGKRGWLADDFFYLVENDPLLRKKFIFLHCSDQELAWLYQNCSFTVFPSFYEGWGLPVAESLFYGKYCLASNSSSIPEIAGDLIEYFSPNDPMTLLEQMLHYTQNPALLKEKEKKIQATYKPTGWDDAFTQANEFTYRFLK